MARVTTRAPVAIMSTMSEQIHVTLNVDCAAAAAVYMYAYTDTLDQCHFSADRKSDPLEREGYRDRRVREGRKTNRQSPERLREKSDRCLPRGIRKLPANKLCAINCSCGARKCAALIGVISSIRTT